MGFAELKSRVLVTVIGGPLVVLLVYFGGVWFLFLAGLIYTLSIWEFFNLAQKKGAVPNLILAELAGILLLIDMYYARGDHAIIILTIYLVFLSIAQLRETEGSQIQNLAINFFAVGFLGMLLSYFVGIRELPLDLGVDYGQGAVWTLTILIAIWIGDSAAYFIGSSIGRHKLAPRVSPKKTIEGFVAGFVTMLVVVGLAKFWFIPEWSWIDVAVIGSICGAVGPLSDLVESLFKRDVGVKDTSNILPGHGGILDRFDVLFLVCPLIYFYLRYFSSLSP